MVEGNLRSASRMYEQAIEFSEKWGGHSSIALCLVQQGRASLLYEWNDLDGTACSAGGIHIGELWKGPRFCAGLWLVGAGDAGARRAEQRTHIHRAEQATQDRTASL
jgi:hypothetical protein